MAFFRITLMRSGIGLTKRSKGVLEALGLRKRMKTVFLPVSPETSGQIMRVKELVSVSVVEKELSINELKAERRPSPGFYIERPVRDKNEVNLHDNRVKTKPLPIFSISNIIE